MRMSMSSVSIAPAMLVTLGLLLLGGCQAEEKSSTVETAPRQPNIVILFADDLGLHCPLLLFIS